MNKALILVALLTMHSAFADDSTHEPLFGIDAALTTEEFEEAVTNGDPKKVWFLLVNLHPVTMHDKYGHAWYKENPSLPWSDLFELIGLKQNHHKDQQAWIEEATSGKQSLIHIYMSSEELLKAKEIEYIIEATPFPEYRSPNGGHAGRRVFYFFGITGDLESIEFEEAVTMGDPDKVWFLYLSPDEEMLTEKYGDLWTKNPRIVWADLFTLIEIDQNHHKDQNDWIKRADDPTRLYIYLSSAEILKVKRSQYVKQVGALDQYVSPSGPLPHEF